MPHGGLLEKRPARPRRGSRQLAPPAKPRGKRRSVEARVLRLSATMGAFARHPSYANQHLCQAACRRKAVVVLKGVPFCLEHYCDALTGMARLNTTVRAF